MPGLIGQSHVTSNTSFCYGEQIRLGFDKYVIRRTSIIVARSVQTPSSIPASKISYHQRTCLWRGKNFSVWRSVKWGQKGCQSPTLFNLGKSSHHSLFLRAQSIWNGTSQKLFHLIHYRLLNTALLLSRYKWCELIGCQNFWETERVHKRGEG